MKAPPDPGGAFHCTPKKYDDPGLGGQIAGAALPREHNEAISERGQLWPGGAERVCWKALMVALTTMCVLSMLFC